MSDQVICLDKGQLYHQKSLVLQDLDLKISHGEFVYLIGRTGSGKTTLLRSLYGDIPYNGNSGEVAGFDLKKLTVNSVPYLRRKLGIIFQNFQLLTDRSIRENLLFVLRATGWKNHELMEKRMGEVLDLVAIEHEKMKKMPHELSGGEQQKVVIARALLNDPLVILADEPTGNLDPEISDEIVKLLQKISREGTAIIMATHDYSLIEKFPARIIRIDKNRLHELD
jgi:cell division transport system ATP-binding protein